MRIDVTQKINGIDGKPFLTGEVSMVPKLDDAGNPVKDDNGAPVMESKQVEMTARYLLVSAYANMAKDISASEKVERGAMALRIHNAARFVKFTAENIVKAKLLLNEIVSSPILYMRMLEILDPSSIPTDPLESVPDDSED